VFGQNSLFVKLLSYKGFRYSEEFQKILSTSHKISGSLSAIRTIDPSRLDAHLSIVPSVQTICLTVQTPVRPRIIRSDDVYFPSRHLLYREAIVPAYIRPDVSATRLDISQWSISFRFFPSSEQGKIDIPVRRRSYIRQESQFKYHRLDVSQPWSGCACN